MPKCGACGRRFGFSNYGKAAEFYVLGRMKEGAKTWKSFCPFCFHELDEPVRSAR